ncbi:hypothetical protein FO519_002669 [Halicephalobus sp. NKZ332]|nr:hypothetical protein FO519_002669 [Halicephalobus sp. NKZ332]
MPSVADATPLMAVIPRRSLNQRLLGVAVGFLFAVLIFISFSSRNRFDSSLQGSRDFYLKREFQKLQENSEHNGQKQNEDEDVHIKMLDKVDLGQRKTFYPKRTNMGECPPLFGKVTVFVAVVESSYKTHYHVAQESLNCYMKSVNYTFLLVDLDHDDRVNKNCKHDQLFFKKHCAASVYLPDTDWMLVLDADAGVVNPNHCIEEWIDDRVDLVFYERSFNWEIASGNYLVKNTPFARDFLRKWADWQYIQPSNWNGADNGVLQIHILQTVLPEAKAEIKACDAIWHRGKDYDTYMNYVTCVKIMLGANRLFPKKLRIYRRAHGWVRDGYLTNDGWSENDFMLHGWKAQEIGASGWVSPYTKMFNITECGSGYSGWNWRSEKRLAVEEVRRQLANFEREAGKSFPAAARDLPHLVEPDIGECYPNCDDRT